jgi:hypothetical protein
MMKNLRKRGGAAALALAILALFGLGASASAEDTAVAAGPSGFYFAVPVYLYECYSASGVQLGWKTGNWQPRIEANLIDRATRGADENPSFSSSGRGSASSARRERSTKGPLSAEE